TRQSYTAQRRGSRSPGAPRWREAVNLPPIGAPLATAQPKSIVSARKWNRFLTVMLWIICLIPAGLSTSALAGVRIKDLAMVGGARENQLVGYGLVVGLANSGDLNPVYTVQSIANALQRFGLTVPAATLSSKNVAAVMVTADIPAFL